MRIGAVLVTLLLVAAALTARLFVWPKSGSPRQVDAIVVLSGDHGERLARGLALVRAGVSSTLVLGGACLLYTSPSPRD